MPNYEVHVSFTHVVTVETHSAEAAESEALAIMENSRGAAFDTREVVQVIETEAVQG
jgi:hypothetical protein